MEEKGRLSLTGSVALGTGVMVGAGVFCIPAIITV